MRYLFRDKALQQELMRAPARAPQSSRFREEDSRSESHEHIPDTGYCLDTSEVHDREAFQSSEDSEGDRGSGTFRPLVEYEDGYREVN